MAGANVPAWRQELTERVRQIKAKRNTTSVNLEDSPVNVQTRGDQTRTNNVDLGPISESSRSARDNNPLVEAALTRVRRAKQEGSGLALPAVSGAAIKSSGKASIVVDREATARALEPAEDARGIEMNRAAPETARTENSLTSSYRATSATGAARQKSPSTTPYAEKARRSEAGSSATADPVTHPYKEEEAGTAMDPMDEGPIEELDPIDYLEAEVRKVESLSREAMALEAVPVFSHIVACITDLLTIAVSSAPFLALILMTNGAFSDRSTLLASGILVGLLALFYLSLTQSLCGKTFGMMLTNTRLIETATGKQPTVQRALLRSLSYPVALAPAGIGILWVAIDRRRRGWQDIISGTLVIRDY